MGKTEQWECHCGRGCKGMQEYAWCQIFFFFFDVTFPFYNFDDTTTVYLPWINCQLAMTPIVPVPAFRYRIQMHSYSFNTLFFFRWVVFGESFRGCTKYIYMYVTMSDCLFTDWFKEKCTDVLLHAVFLA